LAKTDVLLYSILCAILLFLIPWGVKLYRKSIMITT